MAHLPHKEFQKCVTRYDGTTIGGFLCWDSVFGDGIRSVHLPRKLRDIELVWERCKASCIIWAFATEWPVDAADANEAHDWRIFADLRTI